MRRGVTRPRGREQQTTDTETDHIYSTVLPVVDLVVPDYGTAICPDLDPCQGVAIDVVSFDETSAVAKNINAALVAVENGVAPTSQENPF